jgi:hypothetical protein
MQQEDTFWQQQSDDEGAWEGENWLGEEFLDMAAGREVEEGLSQLLVAFVSALSSEHGDEDFPDLPAAGSRTGQHQGRWQPVHSAVLHKHC